MLCADENFFPWIDICAIRINKYYIKYYFTSTVAIDRASKLVSWLFKINIPYEITFHFFTGQRKNRPTNKIKSLSLNSKYYEIDSTM